MRIKNSYMETLNKAIQVSQNKPSASNGKTKNSTFFDALTDKTRVNSASLNSAGGLKEDPRFAQASARTAQAGLSRTLAALEQERFLAFLLLKLGQAPAGSGTAASLATLGIIPRMLPFAKPAFFNGSQGNAGEEDKGSLSARFESSYAGPGTIGYDETGGTSYGTYQISSKQGTFDRFISFLGEYAPSYAARLKAAGEADTGSRQGRVPQEWQRIAAENPSGFAELQQKFINDTHYMPALQKIAQDTGLDLNGRSNALKEVLWSTSVQHGPDGAARIFKKAIEGLKARGDVSDEAIINTVYDIRGRQFNSSAAQVQQAVNRRFSEERVAALNILKDGVSA